MKLPGFGLALKVPRPWTRTTSSWCSSSRRAWTAVPRLTPTARAISASDGSRVPVGSASSSAISCSTIWR